MAKGSKTAVALLSGGLDSSLAMWLTNEFDADVELALTFDYGQRAAPQEIAHATAIARYAGIAHKTVKLPLFETLSRPGALLKTTTALPTPTKSQLDESEFSADSAKAVWVPNRNGIFIETAAAIAEDIGAGAVVVGFNKEEAATFPDNSVDYLIALTHALSFSTANQVKVVSPTAHLNKQEIVAKALETGFPLPLLWSCYESFEKMCGRCESCMRLKRAFAANEITREAMFADVSL